jgi:AcrR family transcriptional regulator
MRDDLLEAARAVVDRKGLAGLTIRDVLAEAGVAPATLYAYFSGKDDLVAAMVNAVARRVAERNEPPDVETGERDVVTLWRLLREGMLHPTPGAELLAGVRGQAATADQAATVRRINRQLVVGMRPLVEQVHARGAIGGDDVDALVELLDIVWDGLTRRQATDTFVTSYERVGTVLLDVLRASAPVGPS